MHSKPFKSLGDIFRNIPILESTEFTQIMSCFFEQFLSKIRIPCSIGSTA